MEDPGGWCGTGGHQPGSAHIPVGRTPRCRSSTLAPICEISTDCLMIIGLDGLPYGHFGDGCVHVRIDFPLTEHRRRIGIQDICRRGGAAGRQLRRLAIG